MKVKELIKELQKQNQELEVVFGVNTWLEIATITEENDGIQQPVVVID